MANKKLEYVPYFAVKGWMGVGVYFVSNPNRGSIIIGQPEDGFRTKKAAQKWYKEEYKGTDLTGGKIKRQQKSVKRKVDKIDNVENPKRKRVNSNSVLTSLINKKYRK